MWAPPQPPTSPAAQHAPDVTGHSVMPSLAQAEAAIDRLTRESAIGSSPSLLAFLVYVVRQTATGQSDKIKAYTIAVDALGKPKDFDVEANSSVRVTAGRLRRMLRSHYAEAGAHDPLVIDLPSGSYVPVFFQRPLTPGRQPRRAAPRLVWLAAPVLLIVFTVATIGVFSGPRAPREVIAAPVIEDIARRARPNLAISVFHTVGTTPRGSVDATRLRNTIVDAATRFEAINLVVEGSSPRPTTAIDYRVFGRIEHLSDRTAMVALRVIDALTDTEVWSRTYHLDLGERPIIDLEFELVRRFATAVFTPFGAIWARETAVHPDRNSDRACMVQMMQYWRRFTVERHAAIRTCLDQMIVQHPDFALALSSLSFVYLREVFMNPQRSRTETLDIALQYATRAVQSRPGSARAHQTVSIIRAARGELSEAVAESQTGVANNPYDIHLALEHGARLIQVGQYAAGLRLLREAASWGETRNTFYDSFIFLGQYFTGELASLRRDAIALGPDDSPLGLFARITLADATDDAELVRSAVERLTALYPIWSSDPRGMISVVFPTREAQDAMLAILARRGIQLAAN